MAMEASPRLSPKQEMSIAHANARINVWSGAVRSGKTISSLLRWLIYVANAPRGGQLVVGGKTFDTVSRNVFGPLMDPAITGSAAKLIRYTRGAPTATILGRQIEVITANDARAENRLRGMTCAGAYIDEATLVPEGYWTQLLARLSVPGAKLFATTNPDGPAHWLRKKFLLRAGELNLRWWHFTLEDNPFLDPSYVESLKQEYVGLWYRRFILGDWCLAEGAIYDMWDADRHVIDLIPPMWRWLAAGVDYGTTNPFAALLIGIDASQTIYVASEWRYDSKLQRRSLTDVEYAGRMRGWLDGYHPPGGVKPGVRPESVVVDPSAASFIQQLFRDGWTPTPANNAVGDGIRTVSSLMAAGKLKVHRSCKGLLDELPGYSWDEKKAQRGVDAPVKVDDHSCFTAGTPVLTDRGHQPIESIRVGDRVLTRRGWKPVVAAGMTSESAQVHRVDLSNGQALEGTGNHPVWVDGFGWTRLDALRYGDRLLSWANASMSSSSTGSSFAATLTRSGLATGATTYRESLTGSEVSAGSTRRFGSLLTARFQTAATSTTPTATRSTTTSPTSFALTPTSIARSTSKIGTRLGSTEPTPGWLISQRSGPRPPSGIALMKDELGTASMDERLGSIGSQPKPRASNAGPGTTLSPRSGMTGSARTRASLHGDERQGSTTKNAHARSAVGSSASTDTPSSGSADVHVLRVTAMPRGQAVWNLTVADSPEYFAADVLVHNCDALRYAVHTTEHAWRRPNALDPLRQRVADDGPDFASVAF